MKDKLFFLLLLGCATSPSLRYSNLNPPPVYWEKVGVFLLLIDFAAPQADFHKSFKEQKFLSRYFSDRLAEYLQSKAVQRMRKRWEQARGREKYKYWKQLFHALEEFLVKEAQKVQPSLQWIKIQRLLLAFRPFSLPSKPQKRSTKASSKNKQ